MKKSKKAALPQISDAEFEVMKVVWRSAPISTTEITERLTATTEWRPKTIQTLIKRLTDKGALSYEKQGRVFVYSPLVKRDEYVSRESSLFLKKFFDGDLSAMVSTFIDSGEISADEAKSLRKLLKKGFKE